MKSNNPPQSIVKSYLAKRHADRAMQPRRPMPDPEQVRRELGWGLNPNNKTITR